VHRTAFQIDCSCSLAEPRAGFGELGRHRLSLRNIEAIARALGLVLKLKLARK